MSEIDNIASDVSTVSVQALELGKNIVEIIEGTKAGIEEQGKVMAKVGFRMFKKSAGMPIDDWIQYAKEFVPELEKLKNLAEKGDKEGISQIIGSISEAKPKYENLKENYIKSKDLAEKFLKGEEMKNAVDGLAETVKKVGLFIQTIEFLEKD